MEPIVAAALRCIARWGVAKTSLEDVAKEAGCSRATLYRTFPGGKDALFSAVVRSELDRLSAAVGAAIEEAETLEDALVGAVVGAAVLIEGHAPLQFLFHQEPGLVLPHLAFRQLDALLARASTFAGPLLARFLGDDESSRVAEWVARIFVSYMVSPAAGVQLTDTESVRRLVRSFVLPSLLVPTA